MNKSTKRIVIAAAAILIILIIILPKMSFLKGEAKTKGAGSAEGKRGGRMHLAVEGFVVMPGKLNDRIVSNGTVLANEEVQLKSEVSGKITKILFKEGSYVRKGTLLVKINDADLQAQLAKANYKLQLAKDREYRQKMMLKREAISQEEYEAALNELQTQQADIQLIKAQIDKTEIRAPFNGIIGLKSVSVGSFISPTDKIATLQEINPVKVDFSIPEKYYNTVKTGTQINFKVQGSEKVFNGKIYAVEPKIDQNSRSLQIRALCRNDRSEIYPGSFANIEIVLREISNALMIPTQALVPDFKGQKVFIAKNGKALSVPVNTGIRQESTIQITDGLSQGDTLITTGLLQLRPNMPVRISKVNQ
ncbi:MAG: efflux RND transporter periplasmic adaptor subunit [Ignavibacteria bacterium]|jgi:membrane fusion protein (multidrug efflux system)|nr:efflux RND transporter periplasmic adaptor subunit [Ignavibacteria bacterium]MCU7504505.1 efflux RND transporter periplasmic adaptor subunit [Ignavibacteria bacterium]MCU7517826.1 efflux RND transporter periplasmic adaptor subunit [Ignavibacteria bacterium]